MIILDLGSGATCRNDEQIVENLIDSIADVDTGEQEVVLKFQLFRDEPPNIPLDWDVFSYAYKYGTSKGYKVTASIFDLESLAFLQDFDVPFVKIACRRDLYPLKRWISMPTIVSYARVPKTAGQYLCCIPEYPATVADYERTFTPEQLAQGISDHTDGFELYHKYQPKRYEKHVVWEMEDDNPDCLVGVTPQELEAIL